MRYDPVKTITRFFLHRYDGKDFITQQKSRILLRTFAIILLVLVPTYAIFSIPLRWEQTQRAPLVIFAAAIIALLFVLRAGWIQTAAHGFLFITFAMLWSYFFVKLEQENHLSKMFTIVLVFAMLTYTPLITDRLKRSIVFYYTINIAVFIVFLIVLNNTADIYSISLATYALDTTIAILVSGILSYQVFRVNRIALNLAKGAEEEIRKSEELYRGVVEGSPQSMIIINRDGTLDFLSDVKNDAFGYTKNDIPTLDRWWELAYPDDAYRKIIKTEWESMVLDAAAGKTARPIETKVLSRDGSIRDTMIRYAPLGRSGRGLVLLDDITNRKIIERSLIASERRYRKLYDSMLDGFVSIDMDGTILEFNSAYQKMTAYTRTELYGKTIWELTPRRWHELQKSIIREQVLIRGHSDIFEKEYIAKDGATFPIELRVYLIQDDEGNTTGMWSIVHDITERKRAEHELLKASKIESLGIFAGGIAHDFNNLLTAIMGNISIARLEADPNSRSHQILSEAEKASARAKDLTMQLLTFSQGGAPIKKIASISDLLVDTADFVLRGSNIKSSFELPDSLWNVEIDVGQISQVVHNLVLNARESMPEGGIVSISAENRTVSAQVPLPLKPGNYVAITISDTGHGIEEKNLHKIFDPFFTTKYKGSGLGLSVTYSIIKKHNGHIIAESKERHGTSFIIYLPATDKHVELTISRPNNITLAGGLVLIMDDEKMVLEVAVKILQRLGYETACANDGREAIELYKKAKQSGRSFDFLIMDLTVPGGMGGKEAIRIIHEYDPSVKAIVSSGYSNDPVMANFRDYGFIGVVAKPYTIEDLKAALQDTRL